MNLNIGCGHDIRQGFMNIDANIFVSPDLVVDFNKDSLIGFFDPDTVDFILAKDIIEHLWRGDAIFLLKTCFTLLKAGGKIEFTLPSFEAIIKKAIPPEKMIEYVFGAQDDTQGRQWYGHKYGYTRKSFTDLLVSIGFKNVVFKDGGTNMVLIAEKH